MATTTPSNSQKAAQTQIVQSLIENLQLANTAIERTSRKASELLSRRKDTLPPSRKGGIGFLGAFFHLAKTRNLNVTAADIQSAVTAKASPDAIIETAELVSSKGKTASLDGTHKANIEKEYIEDLVEEHKIPQRTEQKAIELTSQPTGDFNNIHAIVGGKIYLASHLVDQKITLHETSSMVPIGVNRIRKVSEYILGFDTKNERRMRNPKPGESFPIIAYFRKHKNRSDIPDFVFHMALELVQRHEIFFHRHHQPHLLLGGALYTTMTAAGIMPDDVNHEYNPEKSRPFELTSSNFKDINDVFPAANTLEERYKEHANEISIKQLHRETAKLVYKALYHGRFGEQNSGFVWLDPTEANTIIDSIPDKRARRYPGAYIATALYQQARDNWDVRGEKATEMGLDADIHKRASSALYHLV